MITYFWDIETSTVYADNSNEPIQIVYLSNVLEMDIDTGEFVSSKFFRNLRDTIDYFCSLDENFVWVHNLDYELTFLLRELGCNGLAKNKNDIYGNEVQEIILRDKHSPLSVKLESIPNITFRDTYAIFNKSVKKLGEELGLPKLEYDYKKVRLPWDKLEEIDYQYNQRDNEIVAKSLYNYMKQNNFSLNEIPLTFTSFVKRKRKEFITKNYGNKALNKFYFDRNEQLQDFTFFELVLKTYQGGLTASNINFTGKLITDGIYSIDIKSSYPYQMCSRYFPFFSWKNTEKYTGEIADKIFKEGNYKGFFGIFRFNNIQIKNRNYLLPISSSQLSKGYVSEDRITFNGKLISASEIIIPANNVDIDTINLVYNFDEIECLEIFITNKQRQLRKEEISFILDSFHKKETIKNKEDYEYMLSKVQINSMYGVKVTTPIKNSYQILEGEIIEDDYFKYNINERMKIYENFCNNQSTFGGTLDIFSDGCYITSYGRFKLVEMMKKLVDEGCNVVYSDTDSIKFFLNKCSKEYIFSLIENINKQTIENNKKNSRFKHFKEKFNINEEDFEKISRMGIWEIENRKPIKAFKTYGAKKYGYVEDGKVKTTIAGCNKKFPSIAIHKFAEKENIDIVDAFNFVFAIGTQFDESASGRTTAKQEKRTRDELEHLTKNGKKLNQYGGIIIEETTYTLGITDNDAILIDVENIKEVLIKINLEGDVIYEWN